MIERAGVRRGQAEIIAGLIVLSAIIILLIPFILNLMSSQGEAISKQADVGTYYLEKMREKVEVSWDLSTLLPDSRVRAFWINNTGSVIVSIRYLKLVNAKTGEVLLVNLSNYEPSMEKPVKKVIKYPPGVSLSRAILTLSPGETARIEIDPSLVPDLLFTHRANPHAGPGTGRGSFEHRVYPLHMIGNITLFKLRHEKYFDNQQPEAGIATYDSHSRYYYKLVAERKNVHIQATTRERYNFYVAVIGHVPGTNEFNMLLVSKHGEKHMRIKVEGFVPERGFFFQYVSALRGYDDRYIVRRANENNLTGILGGHFKANVIQSYVDLVGKARSIKLFELTAASSNQISSYDPFIVIGDTDGNGKGEIIFVGEDIYDIYGRSGSCTIDDKYYDHSALRTSTRIEADREWGFALLLRQDPLHSSRHVGVFAAVRLYFHDIEPKDLDCVDATGLPILRLMLVTQDWRVVDSRSIYYWELASIEDTWPPQRDFATYHISLFVPPGFSEPLYVALAIVDPFSWIGRNDVEFTLALELVSLTIINK
ncbi:MAG: hypothetical protein NZ902_06025 [Acidilobaceae archaeon]|nr:hypothetical protein [Acidilobaceae archaeon]MDW7974765.1 hypothetical protein [Sulfolobales archaeon]